MKGLRLKDVYYRNVVDLFQSRFGRLDHSEARASWVSMKMHSLGRWNIVNICLKYCTLRFLDSKVCIKDLQTLNGVWWNVPTNNLIWTCFTKAPSFTSLKRLRRHHKVPTPWWSNISRMYMCVFSHTGTPLLVFSATCIIVSLTLFWGVC